MAPEMNYVLGWLAGSLIGYLLARVLWRRSVEEEIGIDDTAILTLSSLALSWSLVAGSLATMAIVFLFRDINTDEACWFGDKDTQPPEDIDWERSKRI